LYTTNFPVLVTWLATRYPGEQEALQSKEVACCSNPCFDACAQHDLVLPSTQSILPLLHDG
jgi:hypothetical protein